MKKRMRMLAVFLSMMMLTGCSAPSGDSDTAASQESGETANVAGDEMFSDRDYEIGYDKSESVGITLEGDSAKCSSDAVDISGSTVTISDEGTYILSGTLDNGTIIIDAENTDKLHLVLEGADINSDTFAAIYVAQADKVFLTLATDSENTLSNGGSFTAIDDNNVDSVIFSKDDLTINGLGKLTIQSPAGHGVVSKDDLVITGGVYTITAENHGLSGKESVRIADGTFTITAGKDGIHAEDADDATLGFGYFAGGDYEITSDGDGISAANTLYIADGSYTVKSGGGSETVSQDQEGNWDWTEPGGQKPAGEMQNMDGQQPPEEPQGMDGQRPAEETQSADTTEETTSVKGIKAGSDLQIDGGSFYIDSADDALHSNGNITVNSGTYEISTGDDGLHADATATVADGTINMTKSYEGIEGQNITISGGDITLAASDDGLNAAGGNDQSGNGGFGGFQDQGGFDEASDSVITISGGKLTINASGDGVDSNGSLIVSGGETYVSGPTNSGNGFMDYAGEATITGGIFVAAGTSGMAQNFGESSTQGAMMVSISGNSENSVITLTDQNGNNLVECTMEKTFDCVVISCPEIQQGETYTVSVGDTSTEVTMDSLIYGSGGNMGGAGGNMGGAGGMRP